jgi:N-acetylglucosamine-6-sulfatase
MQGKSFLPLLRGDVGREWRECIYYHYYHHGAHNVPRHDGVRTARYKLMHFYTDDVYEMFDLEKDPHELRSVYEDAAYANVRRDLLRRLADLRRQYGVPDHVFRHPYVHLSRAERAKGKGRK